MRRVARFSGWLMVAMLFAGVLALNWFALPMHDELAYAFAGESTPMEGEVARVASLADIARQQYGDYLHGCNGRVILHSLVAGFSMCRAYHLFDVANAAMWMLFVWALMKAGNVRITTRNYLVVWMAAFALLWYSQSCSFDSAFAVNYLWMATLTIFAMHLWERERGWWLPLFFFAYGWTQETFVLPFIVAAAWGLTRKRIVSFAALVAGAAGLVLGPSARMRAGGQYAEGFVSAAVQIAGTIPRAALYVAPIVLFALLLPLAWKRLRHPLQFVRNLRAVSPLAVYMMASVGMIMMLPQDFSPRLLMPAGFSAFILILRHRDELPAFWRNRAFVRVSLMAIAAWFVLSVVMQVASGVDNSRMLAEYCASPKGVAHRRYVPVFGYTADRGQFSAWHLRLIQLEYGKPMVMQMKPSEWSFPQYSEEWRKLPRTIYVRLKYLLPDREALCRPH